MNSQYSKMVTSAVTLIGIIIGGFGSSLHADAAEPASSPLQFERIDFPAGRVGNWQKEVQQLVEVPRDEFLSLLERLTARQRGPRSAWLKSAHYEATLVNDGLRGGIMTASVQRLGTQAALLELGPTSLALEELKWQDRPAVWGSSGDGRAWLLTDGRHDELLGEWTCRGRAFPGGIDFDLQLPSATTSFLDLRVPSGYLVQARQAEVALLTESETETIRLWRLHIGSDNRCRFTCVARQGLEIRPPSLIVEHDLETAIREEDLKFKLLLHLEVFEAPIREVTLRVPAGLVIDSALYGSDTNVSFDRSSEVDQVGRLTIQLPGPLLGRGRVLRLEGVMSQKPGQPTSIPQIVVENSTFAGGRHTLLVQSPLQVRSIRTNGFRQQTPLTLSPDGETVRFQQITAEAQLVVDVHRPQVSLAGQVQCLLDTGDDSWTLTSDISFSALIGSGFQASCQFPRDWEVTDVQPIQSLESDRLATPADERSQTRQTPKLLWDVKPQGGGNSLLQIEFLKAIQPGQTQAVRVTARRQNWRATEIGMAVPIPIPQLLNCETTDVIFGIQTPNAVTPQFSDDARLERIAKPNSRDLSDSPEKPGSERRWFHSDSPDGNGTLQLLSRLQPIIAQTETAIDASVSEYRVRYSVRFEPRENQADRILVYLTEPTPDVRWSWKGTQTVELIATKLAKSQYIEWNLASNGDLYEIRLPRFNTREGMIEGTTNGRWAGVNRPGLAFVPQAIDKLAQLKLTTPVAFELNIGTEGLKPTGEHLTWTYSTPLAEVELSPRNPEPSREFPQMVSVQLETFLSADANGFDLYRAHLQLENGSGQEPLRIKLDPIVVLQDASVGGESIAATLQSGELVIPGLNAAHRDTVELVYRVPARGKFICDRRKIVVPEISARVLSFTWEFRIAPSTQIFAEPVGAHLVRSLPKPTWHERMFGPLGRTGSEPIFDPIRLETWRQLFQSASTPVPSVGTLDGDFIAPSEWHVYQATSPELPLELTIELWHSARTKLLGWISMGLCLILGVGLRILGWKYRDRIAAYWLGLTLAAACIAPAPYAQFLGGALAGTLMAMLIPRRMLAAGSRNVVAPIPPVPGLKITMTVCLLVGLAWFGLHGVRATIASAEELEMDAEPYPRNVRISQLPTPIQSPSAPEIRFDQAAANKIPKVYIPVDEDGEPSTELPLVYVPRDALARWKILAAGHPATPQYLISAARYHATSLIDGSLNLNAQFRVHLIGEQRASVPIELHLSDVILPDADSCLINGQSHPISVSPNGKGYLIELTSRPLERQITLLAPAPQQDDDSTTFDVELRLRKPRPAGSGFALHLPSVANCQFQLTLPESSPVIEILGGYGTIQRGWETRSFTAALGSTSTVEVRWGQVLPLPKVPRVVASLVQHLELRPAMSELRFHLSLRPEDGPVDSLEFELPANSVLRSIQSRTIDSSRTDVILRTDVIVADNGQRRLRVVFDGPIQTPIDADGTLILLHADPRANIPLPQFRLVRAGVARLRVDSNWWGVSTPNDFRLETSNLATEEMSTISAESYAQAWPEGTRPRVPETVFKLREDLLPTFMLTPHQTQRRATQWKQTGVIRRGRLEWSLDGEIDTTQASTFQTALLADRRLRIDSISVKESGASRLVRWTESRTNQDQSRVVLFLSDKTQKKQTISLRGSLPLRHGTPALLPTLRLEDCEHGDSQVVLIRDPDVDVTFVPPRDWKQILAEKSVILPEETSERTVVGTFQLSDLSSRGTIQTSSRHARCSTHAAVLLRRTDNLSWRLTWRLELTPDGETPLRMGVLFPASFTDQNSVSVERAEAAWRDLHDGQRQLDLLLDRGEGPVTVVVQFQMILTEPKNSAWNLPLPIPLNSTSHETLLALEPDNIWFPNDGLEVRVADLPDWSSSFFEELPGNGLAFRLSESLVELERDLASTELRQPSVRLLDQHVWWHGNGRSSGITQAFLSSVRDDLEFQLPTELTVTSVFLDDKPLALTETSDGRLRIPLTDAGTESLLTIGWVSHDKHSRLQPSATERFPWPLTIPVHRSLVTLLPDNPILLCGAAGITKMNSLDQGLERLETLLDRHSALGAESRAAASNRWQLNLWQLKLSAQLAKQLNITGAGTAERWNRWNRIVESLNQLEPPPATTSISWHAPLLEGPLFEDPVSVFGSGNADVAIHFWELDRRIIDFGMGLVLAVILASVFRRAIRTEWSEWLHRHVAFSLLLLAIVWWLFLTISAFGVVLFIIAAVRAGSQYRPSKANAA